MPLLARGSSVMRNLFWREQVDQDLDAEVRSYFAMGAAAALGAGRFIASLLFEVESSDPFVFIAAALLVASVALLSAAIPALRAAQTDPRNVLHEA